MDLVVGNYLLNRNNAKEHLNEESKKTLPLINLIFLAIGVYAVYLSWTCNTAKGVSVFMKIIFALFAWSFSIIYLCLYFLFIKNSCPK
jgi:hypothetical protein